MAQIIGASIAERPRYHEKEVAEYLEQEQLPGDWPRFTQGQIVQLAGWQWMVVGVDADAEVLALKPVKAIMREAGPKPKRKRKRKARRR